MKDSSLVRAAEAVRDGKAAAMVSAGNTGATMASALLRMGRIKGVSRPAIATPIPVPGGTPTVLLDAGANAECQPEWLVQFAQMGAVFAHERYGVDRAQGRPAVDRRGGEEGQSAGQGDPPAAGRSAELAGAFIGNVEGRDLMTDGVDVVVTDGFTGNVALKTLEGGLEALVRALFAVFGADRRSQRRRPRSSCRTCCRCTTQLDPDTYGGAMLLGVDGVCIISHGSSSATAIVNAVGVAAEMVDHGHRRPAPVGRHGLTPTSHRAFTSAQAAVAGRVRPDSTRRHQESSVPAETHVEQGPLDRNGVFELIRDRLADILEIDPSTIKEGDSFVDDLDADSLALIELVEALEEELGERTVGFRIDDEDLADLKTVRDAVDYVVARLGG